jgi:FG-GAP-like repeat
VYIPGEPGLWFDADDFSTAKVTFPGAAPIPIRNTEGSSAADFTGDGYTDYIYSTSAGVHVFASSATGGSHQYVSHPSAQASFGLPAHVPAFESLSYMWGDCDNDGFFDLLVTGQGRIGFFKNTGNGKFEERLFTDIGLYSNTMDELTGEWGDFDLDGDLDLFLVNDDTDAGAGLFLNKGDCTFVRSANDVASPRYASGDFVFDSLNAIDWDLIGAVDVDADGDEDIVSMMGDVFYNYATPPPGMASLQVLPRGLGAGNSPVSPLGATLRVFDSLSGQLLSHRELISGNNNHQPFWLVHMGGVPASQKVDIVAFFPSSRRYLALRECFVGNLSLTLGSVNGGAKYERAVEMLEPTAGEAAISVRNLGGPATLAMQYCGCDASGSPGGPIVDACGVCGGSGASCSGCDSVSASNTKLDACGVCGGDGSSCFGCDGSVGTNRTFDDCGVCGGNSTICAGCDGVPNSGLVVDKCGVCGGSGVCVVPPTGVVFSFVPGENTYPNFPGQTASIALLDCNLDGYDDFATSSSVWTLSRTVTQNNRDFTFSKFSPIGNGIRGLSWADMNDE